MSFIVYLPAGKRPDGILLYLSEAQRDMLNVSDEFFRQSSIDQNYVSTNTLEYCGHSTQSIDTLESFVVYSSKMCVQEDTFDQGQQRHLYPIRQIWGGGFSGDKDPDQPRRR